MGDRRDPLISVVVPTYGRQRELFCTAVDSIAAQTYDRLELVVVDDSPTEVSATLPEPTLAEFASVKRVCDGDHSGAGDARNTGIRAAGGEFLAFLDDDDRWKRTKLQRQLSALRSATHAGIAVTGQRYVSGGQTTTVRRPTVAGDVTRDILTGASIGPFSTLLVRSSVVERAGLIDPCLPVWEDREWILRLSQHSDVASVPDPLVVRRMGEHEQLTDEYETMRDVAYPRFVEKHRSLAASYGHDCEREFVASLSTTLAGAALAHGRYDDARVLAWRAVKNQPRAIRPYVFILLSIGGRPAYTSAQRLKRAVVRTTRQ